MLLVFLMASVIAITLYLEVPRIAMQTQRDKEQVLIDRGEQYKRAIQLFVKKAGRYPGDIKELESFQNQRFLRHRYQDPMTGKDEWRLIHIQNGILTDSKISKPTGPGQQKDGGGSTAGQFVGEQLAMGSTPNGPAGGAANARDRRRASEGGAATMPANGLPGGDPNAQQNSGVPPLPGQPGQPGQLAGTGNPGYPGQISPGQVIPGQVIPGQVIPGQVIPGQVIPGQVNPGQGNQAGLIPGATGIPGQLTPGTPMPGLGQPGMPPGFPGNRPGTNNPTNTASSGGSFVGGSGSYVGGSGSYVGGGGTTGSPTGAQGTTSYPGQPGPPVNSQNFGGTPAYPTTGGAQGPSPGGFGQPGTTTTGQQNNAAADMIRNILTTPRPGGMPTGVTGGQTIGGGIAGVASQSEGEGVKVYNDHSLYAEWEFIFDPQKQKQIPNPNAQGAGGTPASQMGTPAGQQQGQQPGQQPGQNTNPFGNPGSNGGFGAPVRR
uniref:Type II secretion system protein n=1 Tax=Solibacter usitatus (strain Ellin6076) TaxID=234267 RepID=Q02D00_SOLUE